jgi:hypothetical protein
MRTHLGLATLVAGASLLATALNAAAQSKPAASAPAPKTEAKVAAAIEYGDAVAHKPCFDQKGLWPDDVKKTAYYAQQWKPARLLVWSGKGKDTAVVSAADNWLEDGKPAAKGPDEETDLLFPDAPAIMRAGADSGTLAGRHITIGKNVQVTTRGLSLTGNIWVKQMAALRCRNPNIAGSESTFARNDSARVMFKMPHVKKVGGASVELLGPWGNGDGLYVSSGTMIIGPDSSFHAGNRHQNTVCPKAGMILMSGATFQTAQTKFTEYDLDVFGSLSFGTPERPLTKDALFLMNVKARGRAGIGKVSGEKDDCGLLVRGEGSIAVHSADPKKARLVFGLRPPGTGEKGTPGDELVCLTLLGKSDLDGVEFNNVQRGGVMLSDVSVAKQWKNVVFGKGNQAEGDELFSKFSGTTRRLEEYAKDRFFDGDDAN